MTSAVLPTCRLAVLGLTLAMLTGCPAPRRVGNGTPPPAATPVPLPTPTPAPYVPDKRLDVGKIFNGMQYRVTFETEVGGTATEERDDPSSYRAELTFKVKVPKPHQSLAEISKLNSHLAEALPALPALLEKAQVSPVFDELYRLKCAALQSSLNRLENLLTRHNFYDCETILELQSPETKRRAVLIQSDMDVDTDGSDVDRVPEVAGGSSTFQPFTSYRWPKKTETVSPLIPVREERIKELEGELANNPSAERRRSAAASIASAKDDISQLKRFRFLVGSVDPFIVLPGSMFGADRGPFGPSVGDYCVVIYDGTLYPAIVGDVGPRNKMGEASLRICKQILPKANGAYRPVSDLKVTYLVFPGSGEKPFGVPDLAQWREKCEKLLKEIGGYGGELFAWEDLTKPKAPPATPVPATPAPGTPSPAPTTPPPAAPPGTN